MVQRTMSGNCNDRSASCKTRNRLVLGLALVLSAGLTACVPKAAQPVPAPVIAGGWSTADPASERVQTAARFAAAQLPPGHGVLAEVASAQTQVVAGTNWRMVLQMSDGTRWNVLVWHRLDGSHILTEEQQVP